MEAMTHKLELGHNTHHWVHMEVKMIRVFSSEGPLTLAINQKFLFWIHHVGYAVIIYLHILI